MDPAKLQKQLAELTQVVQEERRQRKQAEAAQKRAEALLAAATPAPQPATPTSKGPNICVPNKFDGTRGIKAEAYANQVGLYVISNGHLFPDDHSKLVFLLSYLTGLASAWAQQFTACVFAGEEVTHKKFSTAFQSIYFDTEKKSWAEKALRALKQTKTVAQDTHAFSLHTHNTGWEPCTLVSQYTQGLKKDIRLALVLAQTKFDSLEAVSQLALKINNKINGTDAAQGT
jgi:hypothetical protein